MAELDCSRPTTENPGWQGNGGGGGGTGRVLVPQPTYGWKRLNGVGIVVGARETVDANIDGAAGAQRDGGGSNSDVDDDDDEDDGSDAVCSPVYITRRPPAVTCISTTDVDYLR